MASSKKSIQNEKSFDNDSAGEHEENQILFGNKDSKEVILKVDGTNVDRTESSRLWSQGSYDFKEGIPSEDQLQQLRDGDQFCFQQDFAGNDSSRLLQKQDTAKTTSDVELEMDDYLKSKQPMSSQELRVSLNEPYLRHRIEASKEGSKRRSMVSFDMTECKEKTTKREAEILSCTSNSSFMSSTFLLRSRTKSRLVDPPVHEDEMAKPASMLRSEPSRPEEDDDDPFLDEDIPEDYKKQGLSKRTIFQWVCSVAIVVAFICTIEISALNNLEVWYLPVWKWEVLLLALICGRVISGVGIRIIVYFIERNFLLRKKVLYFVYSLRKGVQNCLWLGLVLVAWHSVFTDKDNMKIKSKVLSYITRILICLLVATAIWLLKTILVKVLASSFHVSTYFDRIQESLFNQYVIEVLSGPPLIEIRNYKDEVDGYSTDLQGADGNFLKNSYKSLKFSGSDSKKVVEGITINHIHKLNQKNISAWNMKRLMRLVRHGHISTLDERIPDMAKADDSSVQIQSEHEAKKAAKKIFENVAQEGSKYIYLTDLLRFMEEDQALRTMSLFEDASERNRVNKTALKNWVVNAFRERKALSLTLNDTKTAVNKLHHMVNIAMGVVIMIIWILILGIATSKILVVVSSQLLLVVFIFGNTCKNVFESIVFLFVMHPYDVGDRCEIQGVQMIVEEMNILTTVFLRYDCLKISFPNNVLATLPISNYYRSPDMQDSIEFMVNISTPMEKMTIMREKIKESIEGNPEHWHGNPTFVIRDCMEMNRLKFSLWPTHRMNHQNMPERFRRRSALMEEMIKIFRELDIEFRMLPVDVNLRQMPETSSGFPSTWKALG